MSNRAISAYRIVVAFYTVFVIIALAGNILIPYPIIGMVTWSLIIIYIFSMMMGAYLGKGIKLPYIKGILSPRSIIIFCVVAVTFAVVYSWSLLIKRYGTISYIFINAYSIRVSNIGGAGEEFIPAYISYLQSLIYAAFSLTLAYVGEIKSANMRMLAVYLFVLIFLTDLQLFGRIGMIYSIFCLGGYFLIFRPKHLLTPKNIVIFLLLFFLMLSPRLIRRGGEGLPFFSGETNDRFSFLKYNVPSAFNELIYSYSNYFSSLYALDDYIENDNQPHSLGWRTFTPIFRVYNRLSGDRYRYVSTIDEPASKLPFPEYNIYTVIRDFYGDFGLVGITILPFLIGIYYGILFNFKGIFFNAQKIYFLGWLFYTPIYNAFSFGGFFISFLFLFVCGFIGKKENLRLKHNNQVVYDQSIPNG